MDFNFKLREVYLFEGLSNLFEILLLKRDIRIDHFENKHNTSLAKKAQGTTKCSLKEILSSVF